MERTEPRLPQLNGSFVHNALELILTGHDVEDALSYARGSYLLSADDSSFRTKEQLFLLECLVRAWVKVRLPLILDEYEVVSVEEELQWSLDCQIIDMVRCDVILRRKVDGLIFILEFKTVGSAHEEWAKQWEHNTQVLANTKAIQELKGEPVGGMLIEGLIKGQLKRETAKSSPYHGQEIQQSTLCYAYQDPDTGELRRGWKAGWKKVPLWEKVTPEWWISTHTTEELDAMFRPVDPIKPRPQDLERWKRQTIYQERKVAADLRLMNLVEMDPEARQRALDQLFPMNDSNCFRYFGHPCPMEPLCFNGAVEADPVGSGLYRYRTPHHKEEVVEAGDV